MPRVIWFPFMSEELHTPVSERWRLKVFYQFIQNLIVLLHSGLSNVLQPLLVFAHSSLFIYYPPLLIEVYYVAVSYPLIPNYNLVRGYGNYLLGRTCLR